MFPKYVLAGQVSREERVKKQKKYSFRRKVQTGKRASKKPTFGRLNFEIKKYRFGKHCYKL